MFGIFPRVHLFFAYIGRFLQDFERFYVCKFLQYMQFIS